MHDKEDHYYSNILVLVFTTSAPNQDIVSGTSLHLIPVTFVENFYSFKESPAGKKDDPTSVPRRIFLQIVPVRYPRLPTIASKRAKGAMVPMESPRLRRSRLARPRRRPGIHLPTKNLSSSWVKKEHRRQAEGKNREGGQLITTNKDYTMRRRGSSTCSWEWEVVHLELLDPRR